MKKDMRLLKRIFSFVMMFLIVISFSACDNKNKKNNNNQTDIEQDGEQDHGNVPGDNPGENDPEDDPYVPYSLSEILLIGSNLIDNYFDEMEYNLTDGNMFDDNIKDREILFLNSSSMLKKFVTYGDSLYKLCRSVEVQNNDGPNNVNRFRSTFKSEDSDGNSSVEIRVLFGFSELNDAYNYNFYYFNIKTNKKANTISVNVSIEQSEQDGVSNSIATYYILDLDGTIGENLEVSNYDLCSFDRTIKFSGDFSTGTINNNYIKNFEQSKYYDGVKSYSDPGNSDNYLIDAVTSQTLKVIEETSRLYSKYLSFISGSQSSIPVREELSELIVPYVNGETKIV